MSLLTRYEPKTLADWVDTFFDNNHWTEPRGLSDSYPAVEVREEKDGYRLNAEMPGLKKEDIHVSVQNGVLTLSGEKKHEEHKEKDRYYYSERSYGRFERSFNLGDNVSENDVEARFENGVLEIRLKKNKEKAPRQITVK